MCGHLPAVKLQVATATSDALADDAIVIAADALATVLAAGVVADGGQGQRDAGDYFPVMRCTVE